MITLEELFQKDREAKEKEKGKQRKRASKKTETEAENQTEPQDSGIENKKAIREDKLQDKMDWDLSENPEEIQSALLDNWKPYLIKDCPPPKFKMPSNTYGTPMREMLSKILTFVDFAQRKRFKEIHRGRYNGHHRRSHHEAGSEG
jgi:hypothetical protein